MDTISDFIHYLRTKQAFLMTPGRSLILVGGEENLLGYYLFNDRSFDRLSEMTGVAIDDGVWQELQQDTRHRAKKAAGRISYVWDSIINRAHEGSERYERVARELARPNRFERRTLAQSFYDMHVRAHEDALHPIARRITVGRDPMPGRMTTYCFLFMDDTLTREDRRELLHAMCVVARDLYPQNQKVIGIATEKRLRPICSYDFVFLDYPTWPEEMKQAAARLRNEVGIFKNPELAETLDHEYPELR